MNTSIPTPTIQPFGNDALLISWQAEIEVQINGIVQGLFHLLEKEKRTGYRYSIPAYSSLTIVYDPVRTNYPYWKEYLCTLVVEMTSRSSVPIGRVLDIPVCYEPSFAPDLSTFSEKIGLPVEEVISLHTSMEYQVFMLGFLPGFAYMGKLPDPLQAMRREVPRTAVPAGSVGLAGLQTGIYPSQSPGGWQLIGRTPLRIFRPEKSSPFLFQPGDRVRFFSVTGDSFYQIQEKNGADDGTAAY